MSASASVSRRNFIQTSSLAAVVAGMGASFLAALRNASASTVISNDPVYHFLNRISWGVREDDLARAHKLGISEYLEEQLDPDSLKDKVKVSKLFSLDLGRLRDLKDSHQQSYEALLLTMIARAVHSKRQLLERMVEFWSDHFNIASEGLERELIVFQRDTIRAHALGNFHDLLVSVAQSPAMLYYLDNYLNVKDAPQENYARELMELHTLGVDGGYSEADVKAVARAFTGWTVGENTFAFRSYDHDTDAKLVLGTTLAPGRGIEDGMDVLQMVSDHPSTAVYLGYKLCVRFVSDDPPQGLVDSTAAVWTQTSGDIKSVLRLIFLSQEFADSTGEKLRRPLEHFITMLRATGTEVRDFGYLQRVLEELGQVPYGWATPDGYPDVAESWINTGGLLERWNRANLLAGHAWNKDKRVKSSIAKLVGKPHTVGELVDNVALQVFGTGLPADARATFVDFASDGAGENTAVTPELLEEKLSSLFGLMLSSPLNQWR